MAEASPPLEEAISASPSPALSRKKCCESKLTSEKTKQFKGETHLDSIESGDWLTDTHISSVNEILKNRFPTVTISGLQNPLFGQNLTFELLSRPYLQILHTDGNHWLAVQGVHGSFVRVYDSRKQLISLDTQVQIANLMLPSEKVIDDNIRLEHLTADYTVTEMCYGNNPSNYK